MRQPNSPWSLRHRAFVKALVGLPKFARADLEEARKRVPADKTAVPPPAWEPLIDAYVASDLERLKVKDGPHARLAALLRLMSVEFPSWTTLALGAGRDVIAIDADCFRAYDAICRVGGVANLHTATTAGPQALGQLLPAKLSALATAPAGLREAVGREGSVLALVEALERAGASADDRGEPSWGVLAHLVRETLFVQIYRRLHFLKGPLAVQVDDFWAAARPLVAGHRYRPYLESLALPPNEAARVLAEFAGRLDRTDLEFSEFPLIQELARPQPPKGVEAWQFAWMHNDGTVRDYSLGIEASDAKNEPVLARALLELSPRSAFAMATLIDHDWDAVKDKVPAWEKEVGEAPALLVALGKRYTGLKQYDLAQKALTRYIRQSPDAWAYEMIAANYKAKGDATRWKETLDEYLANLEDHGLDHARIQVQIANHYMEQKHWADARSLCRGRRGDLGRLGHGMRRPLCRRTGGLGTRRIVDPSGNRALRPVVLDRLVPLLQEVRPRGRQGGPGVDRNVPGHGERPPRLRQSCHGRLLLLGQRVAEKSPGCARQSDRGEPVRDDGHRATWRSSPMSWGKRPGATNS